MLNKLLPEFSVSEISEILKHTLEDNFSHIRVRGEVSGLKLHPSGAYFTLKDANSELRAVCWKGVINTLEFKPEEGLEVIVTGKISYYRSAVQISVVKLEHAGVGALLAMLEKRKQMFAAEGLFDQIRKQSLPRFPKVVGVITSETGAVIKDILHRIKERYPIHVLIWNVQVQGTEAAAQVAAAIDGFNNLPDTTPKPDVLIVARGGGSIEDLWAFNEEIVVRAVANSKIPLISAVGHETDTTLIDYASDQRAPTPTAAAEIAVPVLAELKSTLIITKKRLSQTLPKMLELEQMRLDKIKRFMDSFVTLLLAKLDNQQQSVVNLAHRLHRTQKNNLESLTNKLSLLKQLIESYHYKKVLARGFAIIRDPISDKLITSKNEVPSSIEIEFSDGAITFPNKKQSSLF